MRNQKNVTRRNWITKVTSKVKGDEASFPGRDRKVSFAIASVRVLRSVQGTGGPLPWGKEAKVWSWVPLISPAVIELCYIEVMNVPSFTYVPIHVIMFWRLDNRSSFDVSRFQRNVSRKAKITSFVTKLLWCNNLSACRRTPSYSGRRNQRSIPAQPNRRD